MLGGERGSVFALVVGSQDVVGGKTALGSGTREGELWVGWFMCVLFLKSCVCVIATLVVEKAMCVLADCAACVLA